MGWWLWWRGFRWWWRCGTSCEIVVVVGVGGVEKCSGGETCNWWWFEVWLLGGWWLWWGRFRWWWRFGASCKIVVVGVVGDSVKK